MHEPNWRKLKSKKILKSASLNLEDAEEWEDLMLARSRYS
jgi:hypothetical protein